MSHEARAAWLRLLTTPGLGPEGTRRLLAALGPPEAILGQSLVAWRQVVGERVASALTQPAPDWADHVARLEGWLAAGEDRHVLTLDDPRYPKTLLDMADPPLWLSVQGRLETLTHPRCLAIVGSRNPTPQGTAHARQFAQALGAAGVCVVSGLALGIDGAAHEGALAGGAPTVAVVGTGLDRVYPRAHRDLAHRIVAQGALVSEYLLGTPPLPANFPRRNRLIAGLSQGTLVVEAALHSGSLITARLAAEQGREVFAIPGSIHAPQARGCHALIRQGAKLVESAQDILEDLRLAPVAVPSAPAVSPVGDALLEAMGHDPINLDVLQARTGWDTAMLQARLLELELDGELARLPGGLFQRRVQA